MSRQKTKNGYLNHEKHEKHEKKQIAKKHRNHHFVLNAKPKVSRMLNAPFKKKPNKYFFKCGCLVKACKAIASTTEKMLKVLQRENSSFLGQAPILWHFNLFGFSSKAS